MLEILIVPVPTPSDRSAPNSACLSRLTLTVCPFLPNSIRFGVFLLLLKSKKQFYCFSTLFFVVALPRVAETKLNAHARL